MENVVKKSYGKLTAAILILVFLAILALTSVVVIPIGHTGVVSTFGKISENVLQEGLHIKLPWQKVTKMDNRTTKLQVSTEAFSADLQTISISLAVNYKIDNNKTYYIVKNIGTGYEDILMVPAINEVLKGIVAQYTAEQSVSNRPIISEQIMKQLSEKMIENGIKILDINIMDFDFSEAYIQAIEAKQVAEQAKLKSKIEQEQKTIEAEAQAKRDLIKADAELQVSQKEAAANKAISQSLTPELIEYNKIQKWNGELPQITGAESIIAMNSTDKK